MSLEHSLPDEFGGGFDFKSEKKDSVGYKYYGFVGTDGTVVIKKVHKTTSVETFYQEKGIFKDIWNLRETYSYVSLLDMLTIIIKGKLRGHEQNTDTIVQYQVVTPVIDQAQLNAGDLDGENSFSISAENDPAHFIPFAQTFTAGVSGKLSGVDIAFASYCGLVCLASIQTTDINGKPTGVVLDSIMTPPLFDGWNNHLIFNETANLVAGTKYAIVFEWNDASYGWGVWPGAANATSEVNPYSGGELLVSVDGVWTTVYDAREYLDARDIGRASNLNTLYHDLGFKTYFATEVATNYDVINNGYYRPKVSSDFSAPIKSIYISSDQSNQLVYKDKDGVVKVITLG